MTRKCNKFIYHAQIETFLGHWLQRFSDRTHTGIDRNALRIKPGKLTHKGIKLLNKLGLVVVNSQGQIKAQPTNNINMVRSWE